MKNILDDRFLSGDDPDFPSSVRSDSMRDFWIQDGELLTYIGQSPDVVIPEGVRKIGKAAFIDNKNLLSVTLPGSLTWIDDCAFSRCENLKSIQIPAGVETIGRCAFSESGLEEITIAGKPEICLWAFDGTPWKAKTFREKGGLINGNVLLSVDPELTEYAIPSHVRIIGRDAFKNSKIKELTVPYGVTKLDICAFAYSALERITLPETLKTIGAYAFSHCTNLTTLVIPSQVTDIGDCAFEEMPECRLTILNGTKNEDAFYISEYAFGRQEAHIKSLCVPHNSLAMQYAVDRGLPLIPGYKK